MELSATRSVAWRSSALLSSAGKSLSAHQAPSVGEGSLALKASGVGARPADQAAGETVPHPASPDHICLTCSVPHPDKEPLRRPKDISGLGDALAEYRSFADRVYYDEAKDSAARQSYFKDIDWATDAKSLFHQLSAKLGETHTQTLDYRPSRYVYPWVDLHPDGQLRSIYSNATMHVEKAITEDWEVGQVQRQAENAMAFAAFSPEAAATAFATQEAAALNCEHSVPQSWFNKAQPERGDLHHLFACDSSCNSRRGNRPYDEFKKADDNWRDQCGTIGASGTFEPVGGKGTVARATLYFLLRYPGVIDRYDQSDIERMLDWNHRYPPDLYEKHRNAAIEELQGNRNPLIDFPNMANAIDFSQALKGASAAS